MASAASMSCSGYADCTRARSSRGRPQRGTQGQFREAARTPAARFGSRGSSGGPRSLSGTRCRRPSSEVELRPELRVSAATSRVQDAGFDLVHNCAIGFVCDLIDDAVDDFTEDLVHDVDDVYPSTPSPTVTPMKLKLPLHDAQLMLSAGESSILEDVDEDEDICDSARIFTARVAEEAISALPASPSWSLHVNAMSQNNESVDGVAKQLDLGAADDKEIDDSSSCDGYEEVYSLASENEQESDDELETMAYVKMAVHLAQVAVKRGCTNFAEEDDALEAEEDPTAEETMYETMEYYNEQAEKAEEVEFLGEEPSCGNELSFDFASSILDGALGQAADTWAKQEEDKGESEGEEEDEEVEELRRQTMATLSKAVRTGKLEAVFKQVAEECELETLRAKARATLEKAAAQRQLVRQTDELVQLKEKAKEALLVAAQAGKLTPILQASSEAAEMNALKMKVRDTLCKAAREGRLTPTLQEVAPTMPDLEAAKEKVRTALAKGLQTGELGKIFADLKNDETEELQHRLRNTFSQGVVNGTLASAVGEIIAARKERLNAESSPAPTAAAAPSPSAETVHSANKEAPATPTRSRRRIIGGVVRAPAVDLDLLPATSPTSASDSNTARKRHSKPGRKSLKEATRPSCKELGEDFCSSAAKVMLQHPKLEDFASQGCPAFDRPPSSKAGARLRAASTSAMAMDLGVGYASTSSSHTSVPSSSSLRQAFTPSALSLEPKMRVSASLPSLKASKGGFLPSLSTGKKSAESIAWSMQMSKPARWGSTGLRGSASMVF